MSEIWKKETEIIMNEVNNSFKKKSESFYGRFDQKFIKRIDKFKEHLKKFHFKELNIAPKLKSHKCEIC